MHYIKVKIFVITVLILIVGTVLTSLPRVTAQKEQRPSEAEQKLLEIAARREGLDATRLQVLKSSAVELPLTGRNVQLAKVLNPDNGQSFTASIDEQGQEVEFATLKAEEQRAYRARYGKLSDEACGQRCEDHWCAFTTPIDDVAGALQSARESFSGARCRSLHLVRTASN